MGDPVGDSVGDSVGDPVGDSVGVPVAVPDVVPVPVPDIVPDPVPVGGPSSPEGDPMGDAVGVTQCVFMGQRLVIDRRRSREIGMCNVQLGSRMHTGSDKRGIREGLDVSGRPCGSGRYEEGRRPTMASLYLTHPLGPIP